MPVSLMKLLELSKPGILVKKIASSNWQRNLSGVVASLMKLFELLKPGVFSYEVCTGTHNFLQVANKFEWLTKVLHH